MSQSFQHVMSDAGSHGVHEMSGRGVLRSLDGALYTRSSGISQSDARDDTQTPILTRLMPSYGQMLRDAGFIWHISKRFGRRSAHVVAYQVSLACHIKAAGTSQSSACYITQRPVLTDITSYTDDPYETLESSEMNLVKWHIASHVYSISKLLVRVISSK